MTRDARTNAAGTGMVGAKERRERKAEQRRALAHAQAQALRDPTPEYSHQEAIAGKGKLINSANRALTLVLFAVIVACLLTSLVLGVGIYKNMAQGSAQLQQVRLETSLLANTLRQVDRAQAMEVRQGPQGPMLVAAEQSGGTVFETRLYLYQGQLMQEYVASTMQVDPQNATTLAATETFEVEFDEQSGLIGITTDAGMTYVTMRSSQGGDKR